MGPPHDYQRFTLAGLGRLLPSNFEIVHARELGGIGSTLGTLLLNWMEASLNRNILTRLIKGVVMPLWILFSCAVNAMAVMADSFDHTRSFHSHDLLVARKISV
jgi:hypothetical protein